MASNVGPLGTVTVASHTSAFPQAGSWSMVDLAKLPVTATLGALSRYAAGGVNPYTPLVGQTMCKALFRLKQQGRANMTQALSELPYCSTLGSTLYIGFGIDNLVRIMATAEEGTTCLALCAALAECFSMETAGEVLLEMARSCLIDAKYLPSNSEWEALLKSCAGVLTATTFPLKCEGFMRLSQDGQLMRVLGKHTRVSNTVEWDSYRIPSSPESLAEALLGISRVTRGELMAVTIAGGHDAGWLAAVAEWIFSLDVTIIQSSGDILYSNHQNNAAQVTIIFQNAEEGLERCLQIDSKTYVLKDASPMLFRNQSGATSSHGRVAWKTALSDVFGTNFKTLVNTVAFGTSVGSAARITQALTKLEQGIPPFLVFMADGAKQWTVKSRCYGTRSYGCGFVDNTIEWFPELERCKGDMEIHAESTLAGAISSYKRSLEALGKECGCYHCQHSYYDFRKSTKVPVYCLVKLLETIIWTSRLLSCCNVQENLCLSPAGLERAYQDRVKTSVIPFWTSLELPIEDMKELNSLITCLGSVNSNINYSAYCFDSIGQVIGLFTSSFDAQSTPEVPACSVSGVCAYLDILTNICADSESVSRIHVVTGHIELDGKSHTRLLDQEPDDTKQNAHLEAAMICASEAGFKPPELRVTERAKDVRCSFFFPYTKDKCNQVSAPAIGPALLANILTGWRKIVQCPHQSRNSVQAPGMLNLCDPGLFISKGTRITFLPSHHSQDQEWRFMATCAALTENLRAPSMIVAVDYECMECCIKSVPGFDTESVCFLGSRPEPLRAIGPNVVGPFSLLPCKSYPEPKGEAEEQNDDLNEDIDEWEDAEDYDDSEVSEELEEPLPQENPTFHVSTPDASNLPSQNPHYPLPHKSTLPVPDTVGRGTGGKTAAKVQRSILRTSHFSVRPRR